MPCYRMALNFREQRKVFRRGGVTECWVMPGEVQIPWSLEVGNGETCVATHTGLKGLVRFILMSQSMERWNSNQCTGEGRCQLLLSVCSSRESYRMGDGACSKATSTDKGYPRPAEYPPGPAEQAL